MLLIIFAIFFNYQVRADIIVNALAKYGPNGYEASGNSSTTSVFVKQRCKRRYKLTTTSSDTFDVEDRYEFIPGIGVQYVPDKSGVSVGTGYYFDDTLQMSVGWKF